MIFKQILRALCGPKWTRPKLLATGHWPLATGRSLEILGLDVISIPLSHVKASLFKVAFRKWWKALLYISLAFCYLYLDLVFPSSFNDSISLADMLVSGLPVANGNKHADIMAQIGLEMIESVKCFKLEHLPEKKVQIRIGIHSGEKHSRSTCALKNENSNQIHNCLAGDLKHRLAKR